MLQSWCQIFHPQGQQIAYVGLGSQISSASMRGSRKFSQRGVGGGGGPNSQKGSDGKFQHGKN